MAMRGTSLHASKYLCQPFGQWRKPRVIDLDSHPQINGTGNGKSFTKLRCCSFFLGRGGGGWIHVNLQKSNLQPRDIIDVSPQASKPCCLPGVQNHPGRAKATSLSRGNEVSEWSTRCLQRRRFVHVPFLRGRVSTEV